MLRMAWGQGQRSQHSSTQPRSSWCPQACKLPFSLQKRGAHQHAQQGSPRTNVPEMGQAVLVPTFLEDHPLIWWVAPLLCEGRQVLPALPQHLLGSPQAPQLPKLSPCPGRVGTRRGLQHRLQAGNLLSPGRGEGSGPAASGFEEQVRIWHCCPVAHPAGVDFSLWDFHQANLTISCPTTLKRDFTSSRFPPALALPLIEPTIHVPSSLGSLLWLCLSKGCSWLHPYLLWLGMMPFSCSCRSLPMRTASQLPSLPRYMVSSTWNTSPRTKLSPDGVSFSKSKCVRM